MKHWISFLLLPLVTWGMLSAQAELTNPSGLPTDSLRRAQAIVGNTDAQFQEQQAEVLEDIPDEAVIVEDSIEVEESEADADSPETLPELPELAELDTEMIDEVAIDLYSEADTPLLSKDADTISVDFPDEDVRSIIRNVADLYDLNVVIPEALVGGVSLKLRDVSWRQVFDVVLEPLNHTWIEDGNIIKIKSIDELLAEPVATRVFVIDFATASELAQSVTPMVDGAAGGQMQVDIRSNALIITERPSRFTKFS